MQSRNAFASTRPTLLIGFGLVMLTGSVQAIDNGRYTIKSQHSQLCVDILAAGRNDGVNVQQYTCNSTGAQAFDIVNVDNGFVRITNANSGKVLDVQGVSMADGGNIQQWTNFNAPNQQFRIVPLSGGRYEIRARHSNKCLDVAEFSTQPGGNIQQWACNTGQTNQTWYIDRSNWGNGGEDDFKNPPDDPDRVEIGVKNGCSFPIWIHGAGEQAVLQPDRAVLNPNQVRWYLAPKRWTAARVTAFSGGPHSEELEKAEMTFLDKPSGPELNYNVTYVDWLGLPIKVQGVGDGADCRTASCEIPQSQVLSSCPDGLREGNKCIALRTYCLNPVNQAKEVCNRLNDQIARCTNNKPGCEGARHAKTPEVYACSGAFAENPKWCAALNRNMLDAPDSTDINRYYRGWPYNTYAKWVHDVCPGLYAFPYDDYPSNAGQSGFHSCTQGKRLQITFCPKG
ncbi:RICIN domain-containing protein [Chitinivorax sp. B]|uniref:RICIN domain-containing protein n=1 Tax=Chitinivorax sp. B TaxID=2502235 RepID=UPI0010F8BAA6|nr:RICIN domain-containing protein [Chitinivorax sp. B]